VADNLLDARMRATCLGFRSNPGEGHCRWPLRGLGRYSTHVLSLLLLLRICEESSGVLSYRTRENALVGRILVVHDIRFTLVFWSLRLVAFSAIVPSRLTELDLWSYRAWYRSVVIWSAQ